MVLLACSTATADGQVDVDCEAGIETNANTGDLAPYYIASGRGGTLTQQYSALLHAAAAHGMDTTRRLSWGFGAEVWGGYASDADYLRYDNGTFAPRDCHPSRLWLQQAYLEGKYRGVFITAGQKRLASPLLNDTLSSGDLVMSGNARPPVGLRAGFINFQNIPFTNGWLQIKGEAGYYRLGDDAWLEDHYNYYNHFITTDYWFHYKNIYLRTSPDQPLVFTIGGQAASQFGGTATYYENGTVTRTVTMDADVKAFWRTMIAGSGGNSAGDSYVEGNHVGSWDILLEYKLPRQGLLRAIHQRIWEDGSGIGMLNGFDGLWGLEYRSGRPSWLSGAVIEYIDLTNHSGPVHWSPNDHEGTPIPGQATGSDDYYNNYIYNGYHNRGMSIGSPFVASPLYNHDGYMRYRDNVMRGFHAAVTGNASDRVQYRLMGSYRKAWGTTAIPRDASVDDFSMMLEATYRHNALEIKAQAAFDTGSLYGDNMGALVAVTWHGNFTLGKK